MSSASKALEQDHNGYPKSESQNNSDSVSSKQESFLDLSSDDELLPSSESSNTELSEKSACTKISSVNSFHIITNSSSCSDTQKTSIPSDVPVKVDSLMDLSDSEDDGSNPGSASHCISERSVPESELAT
eukprot:807715_1